METTKRPSLKATMHEVIFGTHTRAGRIFDIVLLWAIVLSILVVMLESAPAINLKYHDTLRILEWSFTILFTIEYIARIASVSKPWRYILSFYGIIDLLAIMPTWLGLLMLNTQFMVVVRILRLLRIFRIFKLSRYVSGGLHIRTALQNSLPKITVFLLFVISSVTIMGSLMYMVEGGKNGFTSIPQSIYWAIVTLTTVGYGDIAPVTPLGKVLASVIMILGYSIIAVPTGIVSSEMTSLKGTDITTRTCPGCGRTEHEEDARFCKKCGTALGKPEA